MRVHGRYVRQFGFLIKILIIFIPFETRSKETHEGKSRVRAVWFVLPMLGIGQGVKNVRAKFSPPVSKEEDIQCAIFHAVYLILSLNSSDGRWNHMYLGLLL